MGYGEFSINELKRRFGDAVVARGRAYAGQGRVTKIVPQPAEDVLLAEVRGSGTRVYTTVVRGAAAGPSSVSGECSCPMRGDCKHVVAVLLAARSEGRSRADRPSVESWRRSLTALIEATPRRETRARPLALQLTRTEPRRVGDGRVAVRSRLKARPLVLGARGNWIKTGATWRDMEQRNDAGQVPAHRALMREVQASVRGPHLQRGYYNAQDDLDLDPSTADLWRLLDRAAALDVRLVDSEGRETIELVPDPAAVVIDVATTKPGDLRLRARAVLGDERIDLHDSTVELLGAPAHGLFTWEASTSETRLIRFTEPLSGPLAAFAREDPITVPAERSAEFFTEFYPVLVRSAEIASLDGSAELPEIKPPRLTLMVDFPAHDTARLRWRFAYRRGETVVYAELDPAEPGPSWRDRTAETAALAELELPGHLLAGLAPLSSATATGYDVVVLVEQVVPWLTDRGQVDVIVEGERPEFRAAQEDPLVSLQVRDAPGERDWFDLGVEITVEGENVGFAELFVALATGQSHLVLPSGLYLPVDRPEFARLRDLIGEARALAPGDDDTLRISRFQAGLWEEFAELGVIEVQSQRWRDSVEALIGLEALPEPDLPATLQADLRPYQRDGYAWLSFLHDHGLGGILADDMGLGKTLQALALISRVREAEPRARFCVVAPTSVVENWAREAARFTPDLEVAVIWQTTARRKESLAQVVGDAGLVITSYALFRLEFDDYEALGFDGLLLDEAQFVKNRQSKTYQCARRLSAPFKLAMTGTPLENSLMDLWSLLSIVAPGLYPQPQAFADWFAKPIEGGQAPERLETLRRRIRPLMRRRTKAEVLTELPPKQEQIVQIPLGSRHARIYDQHLQRERQKVLGLLDDVDSHRFAILRSLTLLRQLSLDPALIDEEYEGVGSAKADALIEQIEELVSEGHRALVFSQFTGYLARIRARLDEVQIPHAYLDGRTRRRQEVIEEFRSGAAPVFLISLKAGGFGLNLTEADYCFVLDPWWNPAAEQQAVDRAHRIGQTNTVMVYRFVSADTIEDKVMALQERKRDLFDSVMGADGALSGALDADDLRGLFDG